MVSQLFHQERLGPIPWVVSEIQRQPSRECFTYSWPDENHNLKRDGNRYLARPGSRDSSNPDCHRNIAEFDLAGVAGVYRNVGPLPLGEKEI